jgi:hypothetical protein
VGNDPVNFNDPSGRLAFFLHFGITYAAARDSGRGFVDSAGLAWNTMMVDKGTQNVTMGDANQHAMLGENVDGEYQSAEQGLQAINDIIANAPLPTAIHAAQDAATPDHYLERWEGPSLDLKTATHLINDTFPTLGTIKNAYNNTFDVLSDRANRGVGGGK